MKVLYWNLRGVANLNTQSELANLCHTHKPDLLCISEPMVSFDSISPSFWKSCNMKLVCTNSRDCLPNLWLFCASMHNLPNIIVISSQSITVEMMVDNFTCYLTFVYAATSYIDRRFLWQELISLSSLCSCPWLLVGYFNAILGAHERHSGGLPLGTSCSDFSSMINNCNLSHLEVEENQFTWSYGSVLIKNCITNSILLLIIKNKIIL